MRVANTTGHFAQYLTPSSSNYVRVVRQFSRSIYKEWLLSADLLRPIGTSAWRKGNIATRDDSITLLAGANCAGRVSVVYCDPPYTDDQYSRYYHVWETLVLYDYPELTGKGLYRPNRFATGFSQIGRVEEAFKELAARTAALGADLVLSYPSNGLLHAAGGDPLDILRAAFPRAKMALELRHSHSTLGASKGPAKAAVAERIYVAAAS